MIYDEEEKGRLEIAFFFNTDGELNTVIPLTRNEAFFDIYIEHKCKKVYQKLSYSLDFIGEKMKELAEDAIPSGDDFTREDGDEDYEFF